MVMNACYGVRDSVDDQNIEIFYSKLIESTQTALITNVLPRYVCNANNLPITLRRKKKKEETFIFKHE